MQVDDKFTERFLINTSSCLQSFQVKFWEMCIGKPKMLPGECFDGHPGNFILI